MMYNTIVTMLVVIALATALSLAMLVEIVRELRAIHKLLSAAANPPAQSRSH